MAKHAMISPSAFHRIGFCPASVLISKDAPRTTSAFAEEGTLAHEWAERAARRAFAFINGNPSAGDEAEFEKLATWMASRENAEMVDAVQEYESCIRDILTKGDPVYMAAEVRLPLTPITGEADAFGTADALIIVGDTLNVVDFKYGKGVEVQAKANEQLGIYALAALTELDSDGLWGIENVKLTIVQPRVHNTNAWKIKRADLEQGFARTVRAASERAMFLMANPDKLRVASPFRATNVDASAGDFAEPREDVCRFCPGKATCPMVAERMNDVVLKDFDSLEDAEKAGGIPVPDTPDALSRAYGYLGIIRAWADAVEDRVRGQLLDGVTVPGYKLVSGRAGPRKWASASEAETLLKRALPVAKVYDKKLISPTTAEKLAKSGDIGPKHWAKLGALMNRAEAKPQIAVVDDPRPALTPQLDADFENLENGNK